AGKAPGGEGVAFESFTERGVAIGDRGFASGGDEGDERATMVMEGDVDFAIELEEDGSADFSSFSLAEYAEFFDEALAHHADLLLTIPNVEVVIFRDAAV